jgi:hypothetical protein
LCEAFLVLRRIQRDIIINVHSALWKVPVIIVRFYWNLNFLRRVSKNAKIVQTWNSLKNSSIIPIEYSLFFKEKHPSFHQHSTRFSMEAKSHSCVHKSINDPNCNKWTLVTSSFILISDLFQFYSTVTKFLAWPAPLRSSGHNFEWAPQSDIYIYHKCHPCRSPYVPLW